MMADMAHFDPRLSIENPRLSTASLVTRTTTLGRLERDIVWLSRSDPRSSLRPPHFLGRLAGRLFGIRRTNPLADARLEALRRYAVLLRHELRTGEEEHRLLESGFTPEQLGDVRRLVAAGRPKPLTTAIRRRCIALACLVIAAEIGLYRLCTAYLNDGLLGLVGALLPLLSATPLVTFFRRDPRIVPARP